METKYMCIDLFWYLCPMMWSTYSLSIDGEVAINWWNCCIFRRREVAHDLFSHEDIGFTLPMILRHNENCQSWAIWRSHLRSFMSQNHLFIISNFKYLIGKFAYILFKPAWVVSCQVYYAFPVIWSWQILTEKLIYRAPGFSTSTWLFIDIIVLCNCGVQVSFVLTDSWI